MALRTALPFINYTSRDWSTIRDAVVEHLRNRFPDDFSDITESNLGIAFIEAVAYMYEVLSFNVDRAANENFLATAQQRDSVSKLVALLGYKMAPASAASVELRVTDIDSSRSFPILISAGETVSAGDVVFEVDRDYTISVNSQGLYFVNGAPAAGTTANDIYINAIEGSSATNSFTGNGGSFQTFTLSQPSYIDNTLSVSVEGVVWTQVDSLALGDRETPTNENIYETFLDSQDRVTLRFGDGSIGNRPSGSIVATYRIGGGKQGNIANNVIDSTITAAEGVGSNNVTITTVAVTNPEQGTGGSDRETTANAKTFAPAWARAMDRAITRNDYVALSSGYSDGVNGRIAKASVVVGPSDGVSNVVTVYALTENGQGRLQAMAEQSPLRESLYNFLDSRRCVTAYLSPIKNGQIVQVDIDLTVRLSAGFDPQVAKRRVEAVLDTLFRSSRVRYDNRLNQSWIHDYVVAVPGVVSCSVRSPSLRLINESSGGGAGNPMTVASLVESPTANGTTGQSELTLSSSMFSAPPNPASAFPEDFFVGASITPQSSNTEEVYKVLASDTPVGSTIRCILNKPVVSTLSSSNVIITHPRKFRCSHPIDLLPNTESAGDLLNRRIVFRLLSALSSSDLEFSVDNYNEDTRIFEVGREFSNIPQPNDQFFVAPDLFVEGTKSIDLGSISISIEEGVS